VHAWRKILPANNKASTEITIFESCAVLVIHRNVHRAHPENLFAIRTDDETAIDIIKTMRLNFVAHLPLRGFKFPGFHKMYTA